MNRPARVFTIENWHHDPKRRKHRWRCQECQRIIDDGHDVTVERRGNSSHGYHRSCFSAALTSTLPSNARAAVMRAAEN